MAYEPKFNMRAFMAGYLGKSQIPSGVLTGYLSAPGVVKPVTAGNDKQNSSKS